MRLELGECAGSAGTEFGGQFTYLRRSSGDSLQTEFGGQFTYLTPSEVELLQGRLCEIGILSPELHHISRPAIAEKRLSLTPNGNVRYQLKTPYRDGTTHVIFEPLDNIAWSDVEPPQAGPKGGGQDARSTSLPAWPPWCRNRG